MDIEIQFISADVMDGMGREEKVEYVLNQVKEDRIIVLEEGMSPLEESALIGATMERVTRKFPGIEVSTLKERRDDGIRERIIRLLGGTTGGLTVIGPSKIIKEIKKDPKHITMFASGGEKKKKKKKARR
jgi:uncharacterized protein